MPEHARQDIDLLQDRYDRLKVLVAIALAGVVLSTAAFVVLLERSTQDKYTNAKAIAGCERGKLDRISNARGATAQSAYLGKVIAAASVKSDVKRVAGKARDQWEHSAADLRSRLFECVPLVEQNREVLDRSALLQARGRL